MLTDIEKEELRKAACEVRRNIVKMVHNSKSGHPGGSLSGADILTVLYKSISILKFRRVIPVLWNIKTFFI